MAARTFDVPETASSISGPPSAGEVARDRLFRAIAWAGAGFIIALTVYLLFMIGRQALPSIQAHGLGFVIGTTWDASRETFGVLPEIWGTLYSSLLALLIGGTFGIAIAIFLTQDFIPPRFAAVFRTVVELLAAIPSVVYGLWGIYVVIPLIRPVSVVLNDWLGWFPLFGTDLAGPGLAPAALVLAIMILPTVAAISVDAFRRIPYKVKEAAYGMGTTKWEAILKVMLPTASSGHPRGAGARLRPRAGRDDGARDAHRQLEPDQPLLVRAGEHARLAAGIELPGSGRHRGRGADVRSPRAARDHVRRQRRRARHPAGHRAQVRGEAVT